MAKAAAGADEAESIPRSDTFSAGNAHRSWEAPEWFKSSQKTGSTWWHEAATLQKANGEDPGASITDIPYTAQLMTAHTPANITAKIYTARIFEVARPDLEKASIVLEGRITEVTGVDFTDRAVLDVLCPVP